MSDFRKCNSCENHNCKDGGVPNCKRYVEPRGFKLPMLIHVMNQRNIDPVHSLLESFGFKVMERKEYPYFFLSVA